MSSVALGLGVCGLVGYPIGMSQVYLYNLVEKEESGGDKVKVKVVEEEKRPYPVREHNVVSSVISKLESNLDKKE